VQGKKGYCPRVGSFLAVCREQGNGEFAGDRPKLYEERLLFLNMVRENCEISSQPTEKLTRRIRQSLGKPSAQRTLGYGGRGMRGGGLRTLRERRNEHRRFRMTRKKKEAEE